MFAGRPRRVVDPAHIKQSVRVGITVSREATWSSDSQRLLRELDDLLNDLYSADENFLELPAADVESGRGTFLVARDDGVAVGCGAVRRLSGTTAEIKRMYVSPDARGCGIGKRILEKLEAWARDAGLSRLVLETGRLQRQAVALYEGAGFVRIPCFGEYAGSRQSVCYEKRLIP